MLKPSLTRAVLALLITFITLYISLHPHSVQAAETHSDTPWPRTITGDDGRSLTLQQAPKRVLSTSVTITGTLLAIDAPLVASATANDSRFFDQWQEVAQQRNLQPLWPAGSIDLEAAYSVQPDLIIISTTGADSALEQRDALSQIAPTLVLNYSSRHWQELALILGDALGIKPQASRKIEEFNQHVAWVRSQIKIPPGLANIVSYNGPGITNPIATNSGSHARLLTDLGFSIESPNPAWHSGFDQAGDFVRTEYEYLTHLKAPTTFLLRRASDDTAAFRQDPVLANLPSNKTGQVYGLGQHSFRIDYFSAMEVVDGVLENFQP